MNMRDYHVFDIKSGFIKPYSIGAHIVYDPVQLDFDVYSKFSILKKSILDAGLSGSVLDKDKMILFSGGVLNENNYNDFVKAYHTGMIVIGDKKQIDFGNNNSNFRNYIVTILSNTKTHLSIDDITRHVLGTSFCVKKHASYAKKMIISAFDEIGRSGYPLVVLSGKKYIIRYDIGMSMPSGAVVSISENVSNLDKVIVILKSKKSCIDELSESIFKLSTEQYKKKTRAILRKIRKIGILNERKEDGRMYYSIGQ